VLKPSFPNPRKTDPTEGEQNSNSGPAIPPRCAVCQFNRHAGSGPGNA